MRSRLGIPLTLLVSLLVLGSVTADVGRSGGIVILPAARSLLAPPPEVRAMCRFDNGVDMTFQLPTNLGPQVVVVCGVDPGEAFAAGRIENGMLTIRDGEFGAMRRSGMVSFHMLLSDTDRMGLELEFNFNKRDTIELRVR